MNQKSGIHYNTPKIREQDKKNSRVNIDVCNFNSYTNEKKNFF